MAKLKELTGYYLKMLDLLDDPEWDEDSVKAMVSEITDDFEDKCEDIWYVCLEGKADYEKLEAESKRLAARAKTIKNKVDWLKSYMEECMKETGLEKFETEHFKFALQNNAPSIKFAEDFDVYELPEKFLKHKDPEVDKTALKDAIKAGEEFKGVRLESTQSIRIR